MTFNNRQRNALIDLLWESLLRDKDHADRKRTGWGTKTQVGLVACIERICNDDNLQIWEKEQE